ncbi:Lar family restriction alleviation protein (plasmid) [Azospirillum sp. A26]|uniref:Lar family restriction alleviation protein n=1 Tax=Azospirillum sp. A26 TaxID=3160607 RepID=UPI003670018A
MTETTALPAASPCEHCGSTDIFIEREDLSAYQAHCNDCGSRGPAVEEGRYYDDEEAGQRDAIIAWNMRKRIASQSPEPIPAGWWSALEVALPILEYNAGLRPADRMAVNCATAEHAADLVRALLSGERAPQTDAPVIEALKKLVSVVEDFHSYCRDPDRPCHDPDAECPIQMGEWIDDADKAALEEAKEAISAWNHRATPPALSASPAGWLDPAAYRKDGTMVRLLIEQPADSSVDEETNPTADVAAGETWETIGWNNAENTGGETGWQFAGWDWSHDCWTEGRGKVVGWLPYRSAPAAAPSPAPQEALTVLQWLLEQWEGDGWVTNQEAMAARVRDVLSGKASATPPAGEVREALIKAAETLLQAPDLHDVPDEDKDPETVDAERQLRAALASARREG